MGDIAVRDHNGIIYDVAHKAQAGAEDHDHIGDESPQLGADVFGAFLVLREGVIHNGTSLS